MSPRAAEKKLKRLREGNKKFLQNLIARREAREQGISIEEYMKRLEDKKCLS